MKAPLGKPAPREVAIQDEHCPLGAFVKLAGLAGTGGNAKMAVQGGLVRVNGEVEMRRGRKLVPGDVVALEGGEVVRVGRGG